MSMSTSTAFIFGVWNSRSRSSALTRSPGCRVSMSTSKSDIMRGVPSGLLRVIVSIISPSLSVKANRRGVPSVFVWGLGSKYERLCVRRYPLSGFSLFGVPLERPPVLYPLAMCNKS